MFWLLWEEKGKSHRHSCLQFYHIISFPGRALHFLNICHMSKVLFSTMLHRDTPLPVFVFRRTSLTDANITDSTEKMCKEKLCWYTQPSVTHKPFYWQRIIALVRAISSAGAKESANFLFLLAYKLLLQSVGLHQTAAVHPAVQNPLTSFSWQTLPLTEKNIIHSQL